MSLPDPLKRSSKRHLLALLWNLITNIQEFFFGIIWKLASNPLKSDSAAHFAIWLESVDLSRLITFSPQQSSCHSLQHSSAPVMGIKSVIHLFFYFYCQLNPFHLLLILILIFWSRFHISAAHSPIWQQTASRCSFLRVCSQFLCKPSSLQKPYSSLFSHCTMGISPLNNCN